MSLKKPIIEVTRKCCNCNGTGQECYSIYSNYTYCLKCDGTGRLSIKQKDKDFKKSYIKNLTDLIEYWTTLYREDERIAQGHLKRAREYSKELDKVVNK